MSKSFSFPPPPPPPPKAIEDNQYSTFAVSGHHGRGRAGFNSTRGVNSRSRRRSLRGRGFDISHQSRPGGLHYRSSEVVEAIEPGSRSHDTNKRGRGHHTKHAWSYEHTNSHLQRIGPTHKPAKAKVETPPTVPSFASPLIALSASSSTPKNTDEQLSPKGTSVVASNRKRKRTTNQLGLTPQGDEYHESEDEEVDEEASYSEHATGSLVIEYDGKTSILGSPSDIAAWIAERKKRWPTKARIEEKKKLEAERQEQIRLKRREETQRLVDLKKSQDEARRSLKEAERTKTATQNPGLGNSQRSTALIDPSSSAATTTATAAAAAAAANVSNESSKLERQRLKVEKLKRKLERSEAKFAKANAAQLRNSKDDEEAIVATTTGDDSNKADAHVGISAKFEDGSAEVLKSTQTSKHNGFDSDLSSTECSGSSSETDTSDSSSTVSDESDRSKISAEHSDADSSSSPEETSSKMTTVESATLPESSQPLRTSKNQACRAMRRFGRCKYGDSCRYSHEMHQSQNKSVEKPGGRNRRMVVSTEPKRTSLYQRMLEKELEEESRFALEVVKYLGRNDFFQKG